MAAHTPRQRQWRQQLRAPQPNHSPPTRSAPWPCRPGRPTAPCMRRRARRGSRRSRSWCAGTPRGGRSRTGSTCRCCRLRTCAQTCAWGSTVGSTVGKCRRGRKRGRVGGPAAAAATAVGQPAGDAPRPCASPLAQHLCLDCLAGAFTCACPSRPEGHSCLGPSGHPVGRVCPASRCLGCPAARSRAGEQMRGTLPLHKALGLVGLRWGGCHCHPALHTAAALLQVARNCPIEQRAACCDELAVWCPRRAALPDSPHRLTFPAGLPDARWHAPRSDRRPWSELARRQRVGRGGRPLRRPWLAVRAAGRRTGWTNARFATARCRSGWPWWTRATGGGCAACCRRLPACLLYLWAEAV